MKYLLIVVFLYVYARPEMPKSVILPPIVDESESYLLWEGKTPDLETKPEIRRLPPVKPITWA